MFKKLSNHLLGGSLVAIVLTAVATPSAMATGLDKTKPVENQNIAQKAGQVSKVPNKPYVIKNEKIPPYQGKELIMPDGSPVTIYNGDVFVTDENASSSYNYGHAAIFTGNDTGTDYTSEAWPQSEGGIQFKPLSYWTSKPRYAILRPYSGGNAAANWARSSVYSKMFAYNITAPMDSMYNTFCSKFVWQSYYYGASITIPYSYGWIEPDELYTSSKFYKVYDMIGTWQ